MIYFYQLCVSTKKRFDIGVIYETDGETECNPKCSQLQWHRQSNRLEITWYSQQKNAKISNLNRRNDQWNADEHCRLETNIGYLWSSNRLYKYFLVIQAKVCIDANLSSCNRKRSVCHTVAKKSYPFGKTWIINPIRTMSLPRFALVFQVNILKAY